MDPKSAPALLPTLGLLAGTLLAAHLPGTPWGWCVLLAALGLALGRPSGRFVAFLGLGLLHAGHQWVEPQRALEALVREKPVEIVATTTSHPSPGSDETVLLRVRTRHLVQRHGLLRTTIDVWVTLPATAEAPAIGSTVRLKGYLRRSPGFANAPRVRPGAWRLRLKSGRFLEIVEAPAPPWRLAAALRVQALAALEGATDAAGNVPLGGFKGGRDSGFARAGPALVRALLLGDRSRLPIAWQQVLRRLGLSHLLAVSGLHVGLLAVLVLLLTMPLPRAARYGLALCAIVAYLLLIGPRPSVIRAAVMGVLALAALLLERPPQALNALACCVFLLLVENPAVALDLALGLSASATAAIVVLSPLYDERWTVLPIWLRRPLAASFAAQAATLPLLLPLTGVCHPLAIVFNLVAIPWLGVFLLCAFPWLVVALVSTSLAAWLLPVVDAAAWPLEALARLPPIPGDLWLVRIEAPVACLLATLLVAAGLWPRQAATIGLVLVLLMSSGVPSPPPPSPAELVMLDVGQGDAVLLRDGERTLLVDGGGWRHGDLGSRVLLPALAASGVRRLDAVALTHGDNDHCGGLADLVRYLPVGEIWTGPVAGRDKDEEASCVGRLFDAPGPRHRVVTAGEHLTLGRWQLEVLHPADGDRGKSNDLSLVLAATFAGRRVLLTGDVESRAERLLLERAGKKLRADVLKIAHHGSKTSTTPAFLRAVAPRLALVSAGVNNPYRHPTAVVLERLAKSGVQVLRTDLSGRVVLRFHDDGRILISLPAAPRPRQP